MYGTLIVKNADGTIPEVTLPRAKKAASGKPRTIKVPKDVKKIQTAVDKAPPGSLILVSPGVYREAVTVTTDRLVIRGLDRNKTILDGGYKLDNGIKVLGADGVAVENMTARKFTKNGFFWTGVKGYRGSYLTATRTGDYGIYAFDATDGIFEHLYGSGSPDAAVYIGQCYPCNAVVRDVLGEYNGLGFSGTNAGGNLIIMNSVWRHNRAGIVPNSGDGEANPPQHDAVVIGNLVYDNNNGTTPAIDAAILGQGNGILVAGGNDDLVTKNRVFDHDIAGIGIVPIPDKTVWLPNRNRVVDNVVSNSRRGGPRLVRRHRQLLCRQHVHDQQAVEHRGGAAVHRHTGPGDRRAGPAEVPRRVEAEVGRLHEGEDAQGAQAAEHEARRRRRRRVRRPGS